MPFSSKFESEWWISIYFSLSQDEIQKSIKTSVSLLPAVIFHFKESSSEIVHAASGLGRGLTFLLRINPVQNLLHRFDLNPPLLCIAQDICTLCCLLLLLYRLLEYGLSATLLKERSQSVSLSIELTEKFAGPIDCFFSDFKTIMFLE